MTTFTLKDYIDNMTEKEKKEICDALDILEQRKRQDAEVMVEPIPFAGYVNIQDQEDTEKMLRDQLHVINEQLQAMQAENQRLKRKLRALGENE